MNRTHQFVGSALALALLAGPACSDDTGPSVTHPGASIAHTSPLGARPFGIAVSSGGAVYVTQLDSAQVTRFDLSGDWIAAVAVGSVPTDVTFSPDGKTAYDTDQGDNSVTRIAVATNTASGTTVLGGNTFRVRARSTKVFVTDNAATVYVLDAATVAKLDSVTVGADPNGLAFSPDGSRLYVATFSGGIVDLVSRSTFDVTSSYPVGGAPQDIALTLDGSNLYVANVAGGVGIWNTATGTTITTVPMPAATFGLAITPDGKQAWVSAPDLGRVYIINTSTRAVIDSIQTDGLPMRIAFSADGKVGVIANQSGWVDFVR